MMVMMVVKLMVVHIIYDGGTDGGCKDDGGTADGGSDDGGSDDGCSNHAKDSGREGPRGSLP